MRFILLWVLIGFSCKSAETGTLSTPSDYKTIAETKLEGKVQYQPNRSNTLVLAWKEFQPEGYSGRSNTTFLVIDIGTGEILYEDEVTNGSVAWNDNTHLLVSVKPGNPSPDRPMGQSYLYDVIGKKRVKTIKTTNKP